MYKEESLESMQKEIRENWFENHEVDNIVRDPKGKIVSLTWGEIGTDIYRVNYSFVDNYLMITGDIGAATFDCTWQTSPLSFLDGNLSYYLSKMIAHSRDRWKFDYEKAEQELKEWVAEMKYDFLPEGFDIESTEAKTRDINVYNVIEEMAQVAEDIYQDWSDTSIIETNIATQLMYYSPEIDLDYEGIKPLATAGRVLPMYFVAYFEGLYMVSERLRLMKEETM